MSAAERATLFFVVGLLELPPAQTVVRGGEAPLPLFGSQLSAVICSGSGRAHHGVGVPFWPKRAWDSGCVRSFKQICFYTFWPFLVRRRDDRRMFGP